jgi:cytochrome o ubiquinol oxidase subunit 1
MIFFVAMPFVTGLMNFVVPLQIGARRVVPVPQQLQLLDDRLGRGAGHGLAVHRRVRQTGWLAYPPLSGLAYSPGVGVDYYIWALQIAGVGTTLRGSTCSPRSSRCARRA